MAHHSGALLLAPAYGLHDALNAYRQERGAVADALTYADQTTSPTGQPVDIHTRMAETIARRGPDSPHARVHAQRRPYLLAVASRVQLRLAAGSRVAG